MQSVQVLQQFRLNQVAQHAIERDGKMLEFVADRLTPRQGLRTHNSPAAELCAELNLLDADAEAILDAMMVHPILINRPLVETDKGVRLCRPKEKVLEIL